jgi:hypothetical protein
MYRRIQTHLWQEDWFTEFSADQKLLYAYFITGPTQRRCGCYRLGLPRLAFDTGIDSGRLPKAIRGMAPYVLWHEPSRYVMVTNFIEHQDQGANWRKSAETQLAELPVEVSAWFLDENRKPSYSLPKPSEALSTVPVPESVPEAGPDKDISGTTVPSSSGPTQKTDKVPPCPHKEILALFHEVLPELATVRVWNDARQALLRQRWKEDPARQSLDGWRKFFEFIRESDFLMGRATASPGRVPFVATLPWMLKAANFAKIIERSYHRKDPSLLLSEAGQHAKRVMDSLDEEGFFDE